MSKLTLKSVDMADISTAHISMEDADLLNLVDVIEVVPHNYGWFVACYGMSLDDGTGDKLSKGLSDFGFSNEFIDLLRKVDETHNWINFDQDGEEYEDLPVYEW